MTLYREHTQSLHCERASSLSPNTVLSSFPNPQSEARKLRELGLCLLLTWIFNPNKQRVSNWVDFSTRTIAQSTNVSIEEENSLLFIRTDQKENPQDLPSRFPMAGVWFPRFMHFDSIFVLRSGFHPSFAIFFSCWCNRPIRHKHTRKSFCSLLSAIPICWCPSNISVHRLTPQLPSRFPLGLTYDTAAHRQGAMGQINRAAQTGGHKTTSRKTLISPRSRSS